MNTYNVEFQSQSFKLLTEHDSQTFEALKSEVEKKFGDIQSSQKGISIEKALFLTCLSLAEDKFLLKEAINQNIDSLESQAKSLLSDLRLSPDGAGFEMGS